MTLREINLIPDEILFRDSLIRHLCTWGFILAVLVAMIIGFNMYMKENLSRGFNYIGGIEGIDNQLSMKIDTIGVLQEEITGLDLQMEHADRILRAGGYSAIISGFISIMNKQTWLTGLEIAQEIDNSTVIRMDGYSIDSESLGDFIERLSGEKMFNSVLLRYARDAGNEGETYESISGLVRFQIECKTRG